MEFIKDVSRFTAVTSDSREVKPGCLFVAVAGGSQNGHDFIDEAIARGATAIIGEQVLGRKLPVPYHQTADSRLALAQVAALFYGNPSHTMKIAAVTGTSGKTTVTYILEAVLKAAGFNVGVVGTVNFRYGTASGGAGVKILSSTHTTPGAIELQRLLATMKSEGVTHVVMEVSSHSLRQRRVAGIEFDCAAFTNLSSEHLDFHRDLEDYFDAKMILFTELFESARAAGKKPIAVTNSDDVYGQRLATRLSQPPNQAWTFSESGEARFSGSGLHDGLEGISGRVGGVSIQSPLVGRFNVSNILAAIALARSLGVSDSDISTGIERLKGVPGRLERVSNDRGIHILVDYAHKSDALEKVLKNLTAYRQGGHRLITVFGCGGDRDRTKRPVMGQIAQRYSDHVIVTSDNPRSENPNTIIEEIVAGMSRGMSPRAPLQAAFEIEPDRRKAIYRAVTLAHQGDLILIAGKGHEDYQIIGTRKQPFDDRLVAAEACRIP